MTYRYLDDAGCVNLKWCEKDYFSSSLLKGFELGAGMQKTKYRYAVGAAFIIFLWCTACGSGQSQTVKDPFPEVSVEVRDRVADQLLSGREGVIFLYARGLCCPSCSLGVRKTVSRLPFVAIDKPSRGVILDPQYQLVEIAVKPNHTADSSRLWQAVLDAGYDPVTIYRPSVSGLVKEHYESKK